jgi:hypothetical protein
MLTTNTASAGLPQTYLRLRLECESLLRIAEDMDRFARSEEGFSTSQHFEALKIKFQHQFDSIVALRNL